MPNENRWAQKYIEAGTVQAVQTTVADVSYVESAPTNGRGDSPRENKGNKRNKGKRWGGRTWTYCAKSPIFCRVCFATGSLMVEDYAFSVGKNRMFLLKRSVDQVGYNNCLPRSFERALIVRFQNGTTHTHTPSNVTFQCSNTIFPIAINYIFMHAFHRTQNCPLYRFKVGNITLLWRLLNQRLLLFNCMFSIGF